MSKHARSTIAWRKHRFFIDVTFSRNISHRDAAKGLEACLRDRVLSMPLWPVLVHSACVDRLKIVERKEKRK